MTMKLDPYFSLGVFTFEQASRYAILQSINQSIIYFNTLRQRAKKLVQNTNVYK